MMGAPAVDGDHAFSRGAIRTFVPTIERLFRCERPNATARRVSPQSRLVVLGLEHCAYVASITVRDGSASVAGAAPPIGRMLNHQLAFTCTIRRWQPTVDFA